MLNLPYPNVYSLKHLLLLATCWLLSLTATAQAVGSDDCAGAPLVTVPNSGAATFFQVNTTTATRSQPDLICTRSSNDDDVWFRFVATTQGILFRYRNTNIPASAGGIGYGVYDACGGTELACNFRFGDGQTGNDVAELRQNLIVGNTYYVRVFVTGVGSGTFEFGLQPAELNDDCDGAIRLPVATAGNCDFRTVNTEANTRSFIPPTSCTQTSINDDEFYLFTATTEYVTFSYENLSAAVGTSSGLGYSIHDGCSGMELVCNTVFGGPTSGSQVVNRLNPFNLNQDYVVRLFLEGNTSTGSFDFCISEASCVPPTITYAVNFDECAGAGPRVEVNVVDMGDATTITVQNTGGASDLTFTRAGMQSTQLTEAFATEGTYQFTAVHDADEACNDVQIVDVYCLADNQTCDAARPLTINPPNDRTVATEAKNWYATTGEYRPEPVCNVYLGGDLFYTFTAVSTEMILDVTQNPFGPMCAVVNAMGCDDEGAQVASGALRGIGTITLTDLSPGRDYIMRVYDARNDDFGTAVFYAQAEATLPVELAQFTGTAQPKANELIWESSYEEALADYTLLRSTDAIDWQPVTTIKAHNEPTIYKVTDEALTTITYYQLLTRDLDGTERKFGPITVQRDAVEVQLYPNPTMGLLQVRLTDPNEAAQVEVLNLQGRVVQSRTVTKANQELDLTTLPRGVYLLKVQQSGKIIARRVVKQ